MTMLTERIIEARYPGTCRDCGQAITPGTRIRWTKGAGSAHETCPPRVPAHFRTTYRWYSQPEFMTAIADGDCDRRSCTSRIQTGEEVVQIAVRRRGRSSDDYLRYHASCWDEMCQPREVDAPRPAHVTGSPSVAPQTPQHEADPTEEAGMEKRRYAIYNARTGDNYGVWEGTSADDALDALARASGCADLADAIRRGLVAEGELRAELAISY